MVEGSSVNTDMLCKSQAAEQDHLLLASSSKPIKELTLYFLSVESCLH